MPPASRLFRVRSLTQEEVEEVVGGRSGPGGARADRQLRERRQLRQLGQQVVQLLLDLVGELARVDPRGKDLLEILLLLLRGPLLLLLLRSRPGLRRLQGS